MADGTGDGANLCRNGQKPVAVRYQIQVAARPYDPNTWNAGCGMFEVGDVIKFGSRPLIYDTREEARAFLVGWVLANPSMEGRLEITETRN